MFRTQTCARTGVLVVRILAHELIGPAARRCWGCGGTGANNLRGRRGAVPYAPAVSEYAVCHKITKTTLPTSGRAAVMPAPRTWRTFFVRARTRR